MKPIEIPIETPLVRDLGLVDYQPTWQAMQTFTAERSPTTRDEIWCLQHHPVYTLGQRGGAEHVFNPGDIPIVPIDRGGLVTYHGPGQLVIYPLLDLDRRQLGARKMVSLLEAAVIELLCNHGITAVAKTDAPGVYVDEQKIASIGLKIKRGCCYHGLSINIDMDLGPFSRINPCGFAGLTMTQLSALIDDCDFAETQATFTTILLEMLAG